MSNRLKNELSPYLLQHSENPVDWFPWGDEAFEKSIKEDKPVFLSIGYSTCHWCHVMEKESFEDKEVAGLMNQSFINIKVDREERPDIDNIYMEVCQMLTGSGGWPLTVIMTPEKIPFFAGTYFPKHSIHGRIGMIDLINRVQELWTNNRDLIYKTSNEIIQNLHRDVRPDSNFSIEQILTSAIDSLHSSYDRQYGGFGYAPKFPIPHQLLFLLNYSLINNDRYSLEIVKNTLNKMRLGGIFDQIGFGFHRYSTDRQWLVPHFEKMLYDQALMVQAYLDTYSITRDDFYKISAEQTLEYVLNKLTSPAGGFYSGEDADSDGIEGKFYLWKKSDLFDIPELDVEFITNVYNVKDNGNFVEEHGQISAHSNILHLTKHFSELAAEMNLTEDEFLNKLFAQNKIIYDFREKRIPPFKDDKILTDWNGLMISAFAKAGRILNNKIYIEIARKSVEFTLNKLTYSTDNKEDNLIFLYHRFRKNQAGIVGNLDDYAFFVNGLLELYRASLDFNYLKLANDFTITMIDLFEDKEKGGFYFTSEEQDDLIIRKKIIYDGAIPSGNSFALNNLISLYHLTGNQDFMNSAVRLINFFGSEISKTPSAYTFFLNGIQIYINGTIDIILAGDIDNPKVKDFLEIINNTYIPGVTLLNINEQNQIEMKKLSKFTESIEIIPSKPAVYFCNNFRCSLPIFTVEELEHALKGINNKLD